jgi:rhodanese-related sulfurtransferase
MKASVEIRRLTRRPDVFFIPQPVSGAEGQFVVDGTWGHINPIQLAEGVRTVGELEVIDHIEHGRPLVDSRLPHHFAVGSIPTAVDIPHTETTARLDEFDPGAEAILFCNGPQCAATPDAVQQLLAAGFPPASLLYYRGGIHDWVTLGLPIVRDADQR